MGKEPGVGGESPTQGKDLYSQIQDGIKDFEDAKNPEKKVDTEEKKDPAVIDKKEEPKDDKKEEPKKNEKKPVPYERFAEVNSKVKDLEDELKQIKDKKEKESNRLKGLTDDEKEEQENLTKLGMDTKMSRLDEKEEDLAYQLEKTKAKLKELEDEKNNGEIERIKARVIELNTKYDGSDGLPKFDIAELTQFAKDENYFPQDPEKLYKLKYQAELYAKHNKTKTTDLDTGNKGDFKLDEKKFKLGSKEFVDEINNFIKASGK
ncbi:hypothetical protein EOM39_03390 [Candidatus Gracilibacteria bacterium]|nr:hypothetical protein [Candidatus Gracilibacteria bacterium]